MENEQREETVTVTAMPANIKTASYLIYASLTVSLASILLFEKIAGPQDIIVAVFTFLIIGLLGFKVGQGRRWARTTLLVLFTLGLIIYPFELIAEFKQGLLYGISSLLTTSVQLIVLVMLFTGETNRWYKENRLEQHL